MVFRQPYPFPMYPGNMRMPMPTMPPRSYLPPGGFPIQPRIPTNFPMTQGIGSFGGQMAMPPVQETSKIGSFLQQANSLFNTAKTYTPYIQQAMPMVKNIPSLLKLYKGFQGLPAADAATATAAATSLTRSARTVPLTTPAAPLPSTPRIFQPPM
ncbi:YqfQ family protein [Lysinibacillus piscis]|uniref:4-hydroxy-3-methylbut-2-enyl diphosphate reductase n=1 Tax=Lysinibacillus piscis TaxID=2518931 RepID=A0ABQ5NKF4_9BACI|nr:YqfQ family protein [Lysinibacillus sp. KH24]GLC88593.1 hypothetical protein LYSBPC_17200 [Lysinibacillus sp. KH24]